MMPSNGPATVEATYTNELAIAANKAQGFPLAS
jgi:hypothetical protein